MKKVLLMLVAVMFMSASVAQAHCGTCGVGDKGSAKGAMKEAAEDWADKKLKKMTSKLGLTEEQASQLKSLMMEKKEQKAEVKAEMHDRLDAIQKDYDSKVEALLDDEQVKKYQDMMGHDKHGHDHGHDHGKHKGSMKGSKKGS